MAAGPAKSVDSIERERRLFQKVVAVATLVPVGAGLYGFLFGLTLSGDHSVSLSGDSHVRYLSGLLLGIGLLFWSCVPGIEEKGPRLRLLTLIVVIGGLGRLYGLATMGLPSLGMLGALVMELIVTPVLCLWQARIAVQHDGREPENLNRTI